ncbi:elongation factor 1-delta-like [Xenia sp. Carnegie-2017]|uniref:elongation factor 1-delta-like n=1 Tax=Xenia sp. Carnegie-2017 TaxID=2897299 RepID=UPI001F035C0F|nr:elongation factor 1-delta-like [Xenia sp. Carnegie-2017]
MIELKYESIWFDQRNFEEAESRYQTFLVQKSDQSGEAKGIPSRSSLVDQIAKARETIKQTLEEELVGSSEHSGVSERMSKLEKENQELKNVIKAIQDNLNKLEARVSYLEGGSAVASKPAKPEPAQKKHDDEKDDEDDDDDDDDEDLFGSDDEEEKERVKEIRLKMYAERKQKVKPVVVAKSNIILDVKPWDDETDMKKLEECVRSVQKDGLVWGTSKLAPVGYGIKKLVITCVVEDDKIGTDDLEEAITEFEDYVQSVDVVAFNKV